MTVYFIRYSIVLGTAISLCLSACDSEPETASNDENERGVSGSELNEEPSIESITLLGDTLFSPPNTNPDFIEKYELAKAEFIQRADDIDAIIWYGRRTAYLGHFQEAIKVYTEGIEKHPEDARLLRHRGHRYISTRQYKKAISDLESAASLITGTPDLIEPDGLPNDRNIPLTTLHGNIWYHLGLAYYLENDLNEALAAFSNRSVTEKYDDNIVSGGHWLYMILRMLEKDVDADLAISKVVPEMDIIENQSYYHMCLFYSGQINMDELEPRGLSSASDDVLLYGLGNWHLYHVHDTLKAKQIYADLLEHGNPYSFAYLAAEADWNRLFQD
jgi:tetratricopeptide (TPR) repeat protein